MQISIRPELETRLKERAQAEGMTIEAYLERLIHAEHTAMDELESVASAGIQSGPSFSPGPEFWGDMHKQLDNRLRDKSNR